MVGTGMGVVGGGGGRQMVWGLCVSDQLAQNARAQGMEVPIKV